MQISTNKVSIQRLLVVSLALQHFQKLDSSFSITQSVQAIPQTSGDLHPCPNFQVRLRWLDCLLQSWIANFFPSHESFCHIKKVPFLHHNEAQTFILFYFTEKKRVKPLSCKESSGQALRKEMYSRSCTALLTTKLLTPFGLRY